MSSKEQFIDWIVDNFEFYRGSQVKYDDKTYKKTDIDKFIKNNVELLLKELSFLSDLSDLERKQAFSQAVQLIIDDSAPKSASSDTLPRNSFLSHIEKTYTLVNVLNHRGRTGENVLVDKSTGRVGTITVESVKNILTNKEWNNYRLTAECREAHYKPHELSSNSEYVNLHLPAQWTYHTQEKPALPEKYKEYFEFLFPDQKSREVVYRWVLRSITSRCQQYLVLCGKEGSGKSIFAEILLKSLHGNTNYFKAKENFLTSDFSGYLEDRTLLFVDEVQVSGRNQLDVLKDRINDYITVEAKGIDQRYVQNHTSFVLATNFTNAIHINPISGRRFSVPEVTGQKLSKTKGSAWVEELVADLSDAELNAQFVAWLKENYDPVESKWETMHGPTYEKICRDSCNDGLKFLLDKIDSKEQQKYNLKQLRTEMSSVYGKTNRYSAIPSASYLEQFFNAYTIDGKQIAKVEGPYLIPVNDFAVGSDVE